MTPNSNNLLGGLEWAENFDVDTLVLENRTPGGLVAAHDVNIPSYGVSRSGEVVNYMASMSGAPTPEGWEAPQDLVDLDWRETTPGDFEHFAGVVWQLLDARADRLAR